MIQEHPKLNSLQLNLLKSFQYINSSESLQELDSLINFYLEKKIDAAIEKVENEKNYNMKIYNQWLMNKVIYE